MAAINVDIGDKEASKDDAINKIFSSLIPRDIPGWCSVSKIEDGIYIGGIPCPKSDSLHSKFQDEYSAPHTILEIFNIGSLISFSDYEVDWVISLRIDYLHYVFNDDPEFRICEVFNKVILHIDRAREKKVNIFIHCHMGISRSVTCLAAYYLYRGLPGLKERPTTVEVLKFIQKGRPIAMPNYGFFRQLLAFEEDIRKGTFVLDTSPDI